jgi:cytochrome c oxidase subunit 2
MHAASADAHSIASFGWVVLLVFCAAAALVWLLLAWISTRRRGDFATHAPLDLEDGKEWIVVGGLLVPSVVFAGFFAWMFLPMRAMPMQEPMSAPEIRIVGRQWWFEAEYLTERPDLAVVVPTEIHVPTGRPVDIELMTRDVIHSFWIPKLQGKVDLVPGVTNHVRLRVDRAGVYEGQCAEFCGVQHAHMRLEVVAEPPDQYRAWLQKQRTPRPADATTPDVEHGREVFESAACPLCHTVRGTLAHGQVGPDLTHVGSRRRIAGGMLENNTANLAAWVVDAQALKPGASMPTLRQLDGPDLRALVAYLQSLD